MNQPLAAEFIRFFAIKYFAHVFPEEVLNAINSESPKTIAPELKIILENWDKKISIQSHWDGVIDDYQSDRDLKLLSNYKHALFLQKQISIEYEDEGSQQSIFHPFGLVIRNENFFFVGTHNGQLDPVVLSLNKITQLELLQEQALQPDADFNLGQFAEKYLNHPVKPSIIEKLVVEFPMKAYFYVKSHPIKCEHFALTEPEDTPGYFQLHAHKVNNTIRLHQWFSGFHDDAQILEPIFLRKLINRSYVDQLTNLYNRKAFNRLGNREIELCFRHPEHIFSILIMDIDHFKTINDHHGHIFGDDVLIKVSECFRDYDAIRYGGEEFVILLSNTSAKGAQKAAERIRNNIAELVLKNEQGSQVPVTISIGIAEFPLHLAELDKKIFLNHGKAKLNEKEKNGLMISITEQADKALYQAKMGGRNQSIIYGKA